MLATGPEHCHCPSEDVFTNIQQACAKALTHTQVQVERARKAHARVLEVMALLNARVKAMDALPAAYRPSAERTDFAELLESLAAPQLEACRQGAPVSLCWTGWMRQQQRMWSLLYCSCVHLTCPLYKMQAQCRC